MYHNQGVQNRGGVLAPYPPKTPPKARKTGKTARSAGTWRKSGAKTANIRAKPGEKVLAVGAILGYLEKSAEKRPAVRTADLYFFLSVYLLLCGVRFK